MAMDTHALLVLYSPVADLQLHHSRYHTSCHGHLSLLPVTDPTAATLSGQLVIIGGEKGRSSDRIFRWLSQLHVGTDLSVISIHQLLDGRWRLVLCHRAGGSVLS